MASKFLWTGTFLLLTSLVPEMVGMIVMGIGVLLHILDK